jgi:hypothetical protein
LAMNSRKIISYKSNQKGVGECIWGNIIYSCMKMEK